MGGRAGGASDQPKAVSNGCQRAVIDGLLNDEQACKFYFLHGSTAFDLFNPIKEQR
jgi:hypothetical protein